MHVHTCGVGVCACLCVRLPFYTNHSTDLDWFNQTRDTNHSLTHPTACPAPTLPPTHQGRLWIVAGRTEDKLLDEAVEQVLKLEGVMWPVHDVPLILQVKLGLCPQLTAKVLGRVCTCHNTNRCSSYTYFWRWCALPLLSCTLPELPCALPDLHSVLSNWKKQSPTKLCPNFGRSHVKVCPTWSFTL